MKKQLRPWEFCKLLLTTYFGHKGLAKGLGRKIGVNCSVTD